MLNFQEAQLLLPDSFAMAGLIVVIVLLVVFGLGPEAHNLLPDLRCGLVVDTAEAPCARGLEEEE
jgi:hypothetical protein